MVLTYNEIGAKLFLFASDCKCDGMLLESVFFL